MPFVAQVPNNRLRHFKHLSSFWLVYRDQDRFLTLSFNSFIFFCFESILKFI
jgi:hypothetical protein